MSGIFDVCLLGMKTKWESFVFRICRGGVSSWEDPRTVLTFLDSSQVFPCCQSFGSRAQTPMTGGMYQAYHSFAAVSEPSRDPSSRTFERRLCQAGLLWQPSINVELVRQYILNDKQTYTPSRRSKKCRTWIEAMSLRCHNIMSVYHFIIATCIDLHIYVYTTSIIHSVYTYIIYRYVYVSFIWIFHL